MNNKLIIAIFKALEEGIYVIIQTIKDKHSALSLPRLSLSFSKMPEMPFKLKHFLNALLQIQMPIKY
jgi:hypothetical protein